VKKKRITFISIARDEKKLKIKNGIQFVLLRIIMLILYDNLFKLLIPEITPKINGGINALLTKIGKIYN
jgi:hypothetical protein